MQILLMIADYIRARALAYRGTISSILKGEWDGPTENIDRLFQLVQLFASKIFLLNLYL